MAELSSQLPERDSSSLVIEDAENGLGIFVTDVYINNMNDTMGSETAPCQKCDSEISTEAERCRECGLEPSLGAIGGIVMLIVSIVGILSGGLSAISLVTIFLGEPAAGVLVGGFFGVIALVCFGLIYFGIKNSMRGPTDPPVFDSD